MMQSFDVLDANVDLFGAKALEASAGTGKTFAIEHLVVRLLLEAPPGKSPLKIEEILAITFTRAAAREMRMRIRANLKKALASLQNSESVWPYLQTHIGSQDARRRLEEALIGFDQAQIFTIHGFCQRMLSEFALEARSLQPGQEEAAPLGKAVMPDLLDFLEHQDVLSPEQMHHLQNNNFSALCKKLLRDPPPPAAEGNFEAECKEIEERVRLCPFRNTDVYAEFERTKEFCKKSEHMAIVIEQLDALAALLRDPSRRSSLCKLLLQEGELLNYVSAENRNQKKKNPYCSPLFEWCEQELAPLIWAMMDRKRLWRRLRFAWQKALEPILEERGIFSPDHLLSKMQRALCHPEFVDRTRSRYRAAVIDEFQDTDAVQWEIFSTLLKDLRLYYLVGDPKQSIYRFRNADLYTYFKAIRSLDSKAHFSLDTNYRSQPKLVDALNTLFSDHSSEPWLLLPAENRTVPYRPVQAGLSIEWDAQDGKKPLHFFKVSDLKEESYRYIARQIRLLRRSVQAYSSFAILVKSHDQAADIQAYLQKLSLPCIRKGNIALGDTLAAQALEELFDALYSPRDPSCQKRFLAGPFIGAPIEDLLELPDVQLLYTWKETLDQKGMAAFFREFLANRYETITARGAAFFRDVFQVIEMLLEIRTVSFEAIGRFFRELQDADSDDSAIVRRRKDGEEDAVQIMTMHTSKGLEFDIVFALGAASSSGRREEDELDEEEAEKLRQLYVALTRAKLQLHIPLFVGKPNKSPLQLLWNRSKLGEGGLSIVQKLCEINPSISLSEIEEAAPLDLEQQSLPEISPPKALSFPRAHGWIHSFSSLAKMQESHEALAPLEEEKSLHTFPRGAESGTVFHKIFQRAFSEEAELEKIVREEIRFSQLEEWEEIVLDTARQILSLPLLDGTTLQEIDRCKARAEMEFFFHEPPHLMKGSIDLLIQSNGRLYLLDWKTNWLGSGDDSYTQEHLRKAMDQHDYWMQASLYAEASRRAWPDLEIGGAYYLFVRGIRSPNRGVLFFQPKPFRLP